jgi:hypothetical protein
LFSSVAVIVSDRSQSLLIINRFSQRLSLVADRPQPRRPSPGRHKQKKKYMSSLITGRLAAAANILRDNARSKQSTLKNPTMKGKTLRVDVEFA